MPEEVVHDGFRINARQLDPDVVLATIAGDLDLQTVPQATAFLAHATATTPRHLILDLSGVLFLASSGISLLIAAGSESDDIHGRLHLIGVTDNLPVERPLTMVGMLNSFDIAPDLESLLARLHAVEPQAD